MSTRDWRPFNFGSSRSSKIILPVHTTQQVPRQQCVTPPQTSLQASLPLATVKEPAVLFQLTAATEVPIRRTIVTWLWICSMAHASFSKAELYLKSVLSSMHKTTARKSQLVGS